MTTGGARVPEHGAASILLIGVLLIGLAFVGVAVDGARAFTARRDLQNVADAAALAGAGAVDEAAYRASGGTVVRVDAVRARGDVDRVLQTSGLPTGTRGAVTVAADRVTVRLERAVPMTFLRIVGVRAQVIGATADASPSAG